MKKNRFCQECGKEIMEGENHCSNCGKDIRGFFSKNKLAVGIFLAVILAISIKAGISFVNKKSHAVSNQTSVSNETSNPSEQQKKDKKEIKTFNVGEEVATSSELAYKISESKVVHQIQSASGDGKALVADGDFLAITISVKNNGKTKNKFNQREFALVNSETNEVIEIDDNSEEASFELSSKERIYNKNAKFVEWYDGINPQAEKKLFLVFTIQKDTDVSKLMLAFKDRDEVYTSKIQ